MDRGQQRLHNISALSAKHHQQQQRGRRQQEQDDDEEEEEGGGGGGGGGGAVSPGNHSQVAVARARQHIGSSIAHVVQMSRQL